jgi:hypothetical protein
MFEPWVTFEVNAQWGKRTSVRSGAINQVIEQPSSGDKTFCYVYVDGGFTFVVNMTLEEFHARVEQAEDDWKADQEAKMQAEFAGYFEGEPINPGQLSFELDE